MLFEDSFNSVRNYLKNQFAAHGQSETLVRTYSGEETWVACASYVPFISAAVLVLRKNNSEFVSFHARQALVILLIAIVLLLLLPGYLKMFLAVVIYAVLVYGAYKAIKGNKWYLPLVTELTHTINL
ncbi:MAG: hypothetical protein WD187_03150 [Candidatus Woykebacteria bacterium]